MDGRKHTEESKHKMSCSALGRIPHNKGKTPSKETIVKMVNTRRKNGSYKELSDNEKNELSEKLKTFYRRKKENGK